MVKIITWNLAQRDRAWRILPDTDAERLIVGVPLWVVSRFSSYKPAVDSVRRVCLTVAVVVAWVMCIAVVVFQWDDIAW